MNNSMNCFPITESDILMGDNNGIIQGGSDSGFTEAEIDDLLNNRSSSSTSLTTGNNDQMPEFDCFKGVEGGHKDQNNLAWWSGEFDHVNSTSPSCWNSVAMQVHQSEEMYRNFGVAGYSMQ